MSDQAKSKPGTSWQDQILLRGEDIARILNISRAMAYQLIQRGEIPAVRIGRAVRVRPSDLESFISQNLHGMIPSQVLSSAG